MRRIILVLLGVTAIIASLTPVAAQASASPSHTAVIMPNGVKIPSIPALAASQAMSRRISLSRTQCAVLRRSLRNPEASCTIAESAQLSEIRATANTTEWFGYLQACAEVDSSGNCNTQKWWVNDYFQVVTNSSTYQAWNQGTPICSANHTGYSWCSYAGNGTTDMQEGMNFGSGGWVRMDISGRYYYCDMRGPAWANPLGELAGNSDYPCPYIGSGT
jgi:hypothetical protein